MLEISETIKIMKQFITLCAINWELNKPYLCVFHDGRGYEDVPITFFD